MSNRLLVVGARPGSLGAAVVRAAKDFGIQAISAGIFGSEDHELDCTRSADIYTFLKQHQPDHVVCTVGVNMTGTIEGKGWVGALDTSMRINFIGPMVVLGEWARLWRDKIGEKDKAHEPLRHFVAISSNSAHIARSNSAGYCASKAALSMGIRCAARQEAHWPLVIYGYEPGWIDYTPMSQEVLERMAGGGAPHRIPGARTLDPDQLATMIISNIREGSRALNGCLLRIDGGEQ